MQLDIVSDTICPWCYIGKKRLDQAIVARPELGADIRWRPFQLDPTIPAEGMDRKTYMSRKFGPEKARAVYGAIKEAGQDAGIDFQFEKIQRTPNTIDSHRLIRWSHSAGVQNAVVSLLFQRFFEEGADIGDKAILLDVAIEAGMDQAIVSDLLSSDADIEHVRAEDQSARELGIQGVPCFVMENKYMLMGAQDTDTMIRIYDKVQVKLNRSSTDSPIGA